MVSIGGPFVVLNDGRRMPQVGLGTWKSKEGEVKAAVKAAVGIGYRHIDCAAIYGNEHEVGEALTELFSEGVVSRDELWITSKLWNASHAADDVPKACAKTLEDLRLDYLDLYLIHWPVTGNAGAELTPTIAETWAAMEALQAEGLARSIGVSNWSAKKLLAMRAHAKIFPAVNQVELHPMHRQDALLAACAEFGTHLTAYSPLGSPDSASMIKHDGASVMEHAAVTGVADATGRAPAQVLVRWAVQRGTSVVSKSANPARIVTNFDIFDFEISDEDMKSFDKLNCGWRHLLWDEVSMHPDYPFKDELPQGYTLRKAPLITSSGN